MTFVNKDAIESALQDDRRNLTMALVDGRPHAFLNGTDLGAFPKKEGFDEWLSTGEPYKALLEPVDDKGNYKVRVALYRDLPKYYTSHEQTVVALTGYKSKKAQEVIDYMQEDAVLYAREDNDDYDRVVVFYDETVIGFMPKKISKRFLDTEPVLTVYDHGEDDDSDKIQPFVRIYW